VEFSLWESVCPAPRFASKNLLPRPQLAQRGIDRFGLFQRRAVAGARDRDERRTGDRLLQLARTFGPDRVIFFSEITAVGQRMRASSSADTGLRRGRRSPPAACR